MKRTIKALSIFTVVLSLVTSCTIIDNRYVASVNGEQIKLSAFNYYIEASKSVVAKAAGGQADANFWANTDIGGKKAGDVVKEKALDEAIKDVLIAQKAKESGIVIDQTAKDAVAKQKGDFITQNGGKEQYDAFLKQYNITDADMTSSLEKSYLKQKLFEKMSKDDPAFKSDDVALKDYFSKNYMRARHILIMTVDQKTQQPLPADALKQAKDKADAILAQLKGGADFVQLMDTVSEDPGSKSQPEGYIFGKGEMVKEFEDATAALKEGEISGVVQSQFGYHIICREPLMEKYDSFIADAQNKTKLQNAIGADLMEKKVEEWKKAAKIETNDAEVKKIVIK